MLSPRSGLKASSPGRKAWDCDPPNPEPTERASADGPGRKAWDFVVRNQIAPLNRQARGSGDRQSAPSMSIPFQPPTATAPIHRVPNPEPAERASANSPGRKAWDLVVQMKIAPLNHPARGAGDSPPPPSISIPSQPPPPIPIHRSDPLRPKPSPRSGHQPIAQAVRPGISRSPMKSQPSPEPAERASANSPGRKAWDFMVHNEIAHPSPEPAERATAPTPFIFLPADPSDHTQSRASPRTAHTPPETTSADDAALDSRCTSVPAARVMHSPRTSHIPLATQTLGPSAPSPTSTSSPSDRARHQPAHATDPTTGGDAGGPACHCQPSGRNRDSERSPQCTNTASRSNPPAASPRDS